jgi:hypothetical protein
MKNKKGVIIILSVVIFVGLMIIVIVCTTNIRAKTFDARRWDEYPDKRWMMIGSLKEQYCIVGLSRSNIIELLGNNEVLLNNRDMLEYLISPGLGDVEGLLLYFNDKDIVYKYEISEH